MTERTFIANIVNIGAESVHGTSVSASKRLGCFDWVFAPAADIKMYAATGHLYSAVQEENMEWMDITLGGILDYNGVIYPLNGAAGTGVITSHGSSATAKDHTFTPPITYPVVDPKTYTLEQGDSVRAHKTTYGLFTSFGYTVSRKDTKVSGKALAQAITDNATLTVSPTAIALAPVVGKHVNLYLDSSAANIGTTLVTRGFSVEYLFDGIYSGFYPLNRASLSFTGHVNSKPKCTLKLLLEADSVGMGILSNMQSGATLYCRVNAQGSVIDNLHVGTITGGPTGGTFTLTYKGQTTAGIAYNATGATVQTALRLLSTIPATTTVTGNAGGPYSVIFSPTDTLSQDLTTITSNSASLSGGTTPAISNPFVLTTSYNTFQHDMAIKVAKPNAFTNEQDIFAVPWDFEVVEDSAWNSGQAQVFVVTNLLTAL